MSKDKDTEVKLSARTSLSELLAQLDNLRQGFEAGALQIEHAGQMVELTPSDIVEVSIEAKTKDRSERVSFEITWQRPPEIESLDRLRIGHQSTPEQVEGVETQTVVD